MIRRGRGALANKLPCTARGRRGRERRRGVLRSDDDYASFGRPRDVMFFRSPITPRFSENSRDSEVLPQHLVVRTRHKHVYNNIIYNIIRYIK